MAQNITIAGASYPAVPALLIPLTGGGGNAQFTDVSDTTATASDVASGKYFYTNDGTKTAGTASGGGGGAYAWFGDGAEKVGTVINQTINLHSDTTYDTWTPSTTEKTIKAASTSSDYETNLNFNKYDYLIFYKGFIEPEYIAGTTMKNTIYRNIRYSANYLYGYTSAATNSSAPLTNTVTSQQTFNISVNGFTYYYDSTGNIASGIGTYGIYSDGLSITTSSISDGILTISLKLGALKAKCNSTRFSTTRAGQVDTANTNYYMTVDLYRAPHGKTFGSYISEKICDDINA